MNVLLAAKNDDHLKTGSQFIQFSNITNIQMSGIWMLTVEGISIEK
jgi:hypothetical protein